MTYVYISMNEVQDILNQISEIDKEIKQLLDNLVSLKEQRRQLRRQLSQALVQAEPTISKAYRKSPETQQDKKIFQILAGLNEGQLSRLAEAIAEAAKQEERR